MARLWGSIYGTAAHHLGPHWVLSREEQTLLSSGLFDLLKALPKSQSKRVQAFMKDWMPYAAFFGILAAVTYPRIQVSAAQRRRYERGNNGRQNGFNGQVGQNQTQSEGTANGSGATVLEFAGKQGNYTASPLNDYLGRSQSVGLDSA